MKKHLLGLFAIAMAIGFSAFTKIQTQSRSSDSDTELFLFSGCPTISSEVANLSKWTYQSFGELCSSDFDEKACSFMVNPIFVDVNHRLQYVNITPGCGAYTGCQFYNVVSVTAIGYSSSKIGNADLP